MVEKRKIQLPYRTVQKIKAEECEAFFSRKPNYARYVNHLGEVRWMRPEEAEQQHEFFLHEERFFHRLKKTLLFKRPTELDKLPPAERELRLQIRKYLEETYDGRLSAETARHIPPVWEHQLSPDTIENIPVTLEIIESIGWNKYALFGLLTTLLVLVGILVYFWQFESPKPGRLLVKTNVAGTRVYLNGTEMLGYSDRELANIPVGTHRVSVTKAGYIAIPTVQEVTILPDSLVVIHFQLKPKTSQIVGYLKIFADQRDSYIYVDDKPFGRLQDQELIALESGRHMVRVEKSGYVTLPAEKLVTITPGDTTILILEQVPITNRGRRRLITAPRINTGTLEITSNISGAKILINGKDTGKETDYVFTEIPLGRHVVQVVKQGYESDPPQIEVILTSAQPNAEIAFRLLQKFEKVSIRTNPLEGDIFINGKLMGKGTFEGLLEIGPHEITFGSLKGYKTPRPQTIQLQPGHPIELTVQYFPELHILAEVTDDGNIQVKNGEIFMGYTLRNRGFSASNEARPEVVYLERLNNYFWKLGFAFPWRNPKGNDAIKFTFNLPQKMNYEQKFILKLQAAASREEKYPLSLTTKVAVYVKFNGAILSYYYEPQFLEDLNGMETVEWDITPYIRPGLNSLVISTTDENNVFYFIKRIEIFN